MKQEHWNKPINIHFFAALITAFLIMSPALDAQLNLKKLTLPDEDKGFSGRLNVSFSLNKGNSDSVILDSDIALAYQKKKFSYSLRGNLQYEEKDGESFVSKGSVIGRTIRHLSKKFMMEAYVQQEFDKIILLQSRRQAGGGIRFQVFTTNGEQGKKNKLSMDMGLGFLWEESIYESTEDSAKENTSSLQSKSYITLDWKINDKLSLFIDTNIQVDTSDLDSFRSFSELNFEFLISKHLTYQTKIQYRYDNAPPDTVKPTDIYLRNGISLKF